MDYFCLTVPQEVKAAAFPPPGPHARRSHYLHGIWSELGPDPSPVTSTMELALWLTSAARSATILAPPGLSIVSTS